MVGSMWWLIWIWIWSANTGSIGATFVQMICSCILVNQMVVMVRMVRWGSHHLGLENWWCFSNHRDVSKKIWCRVGGGISLRGRSVRLRRWWWWWWRFPRPNRTRVHSATFVVISVVEWWGGVCRESSSSWDGSLGRVLGQWALVCWQADVKVRGSHCAHHLRSQHLRRRCRGVRLFNVQWTHLHWRRSATDEFWPQLTRIHNHTSVLYCTTKQVYKINIHTLYWFTCFHLRT